MRYLVNTTLIHDQRTYEAGDHVELSDEQAAPLVTLSVVTPAEEPKDTKKPKAK